MTRHYLAIPYLVVNLMFDPAIILLLGWGVVHGIGPLSGAKPFHQPWAKHARRVLLALLIASMILLCPYAIWGIAVFVQQIADPIGASRSFPAVPVYQDILHLLIELNTRYPSVYFVCGCALWLFGFPQSRRPKARG